MFTRWQKRKRKSAIEVPPQGAFLWQWASMQLGQLAKRIKMALKRSQSLDEGLAERDRIPW